MQASIVRTTFLTALADLFMLLLIMVFCLVLRRLFGGAISPEMYVGIFSSLLLVIPIYTLFGLYPPILISSPDAVRRLTLGTSCLFLIIFALTFFFRSGENYSRFALLLAWMLSLLVMPVWRGMVKRHFSRYAWWGNELILCGSREWVEKAVRALLADTAIGLKPCGVVLFDDADNPLEESEQTLPIRLNDSETLNLPILALQNLPDYARAFNSPYAIMNIHALSPGASAHMAKLSCHFKKTFFVFPFLEHLNCWTDLTDMGGHFVLETRQKLLDIRRQHIKRGIDLLLTFAGAVVFIPATLVIAVLIKREDGGPVFFAHTRLGKGGKHIKVLKFRTMVPDADAVLKEKLAADPQLAEEWEANHKLKNDPRITRVGRFLRKTSLDELPQVWNVFKGELSFVGPRPIVDAEIEKYGSDGYEIYKRVLPGLTGYWQISGRSTTTYEERVRLDTYYIRNWSVWLDIYVIACTPRALLRTGEAY